MKNSMSKRNILNLAMLLAPFVICLTVFIDLMVNIGHYKDLSELNISIWPYFTITVIASVLGFVASGYVFVAVVFLKKEMKHIRTIIIISHLCFLLELFYSIQYVYMQEQFGGAKPMAIVSLVLGILGIIGFFTAMFLHKGPNFIAYFIAAAIYFVFMILMVVQIKTRDNGMHIILLIFYTIAMLLAILGIYNIYLKKK